MKKISVWKDISKFVGEHIDLSVDHICLRYYLFLLVAKCFYKNSSI
jgi:hypothetical protein